MRPACQHSCTHERLTIQAPCEIPWKTLTVLVWHTLASSLPLVTMCVAGESAERTIWTSHPADETTGTMDSTLSSSSLPFTKKAKEKQFLALPLLHNQKEREKGHMESGGGKAKIGKDGLDKRCQRTV